MVDVLVNDTDPDTGAVLTVTTVSTPTHGSAAITDNGSHLRARYH